MKYITRGLGLPSVNVHSFVNVSEANGPGRRCVLWVQGCSIGCPGCCNPDTWSSDGGRYVYITEIFSWILKAKKEDGITGLTLTGGEPSFQSRALVHLLRLVRRHARGLSVMMYTGREARDFQSRHSNWRRELWRQCDLVVAGPYVQERRVQGHIVASGNQIVHAPRKRYRKGFRDWAPYEVIIGPDGHTIQTGTMPDVAE